MIWADIGIQDKTQLVRLNGNLNVQRYIVQVMNPHVQPHAQQAGANSPFSMIMPGPMVQMWCSSICREQASLYM